MRAWGANRAVRMIALLLLGLSLAGSIGCGGEASVVVDDATPVPNQGSAQ